MLKMISIFLMLISAQAFADRPVAAADLKDTCWGTQLGGYNGKKWNLFFFRHDGTGEIRRVEKFRGVVSGSALTWSVENGELTYTLREPQFGSIGSPGSGLKRMAILSDDGKFLTVQRTLRSPWYLRDCKE